jgi:hypothetical protein
VKIRHGQPFLFCRPSCSQLCCGEGDKICWSSRDLDRQSGASSGAARMPLGASSSPVLVRLRERLQVQQLVSPTYKQYRRLSQIAGETMISLKSAKVSCKVYWDRSRVEMAVTTMHRDVSSGSWPYLDGIKCCRTL